MTLFGLEAIGGIVKTVGDIVTAIRTLRGA